MIPHDNLIYEELAVLLSNTEDGTLKCCEVYVKLAERFPCLSHKEIHEPYQHSRSIWANSVQFVRRRMVENGMIYRPDHPNSRGKGWWTITERGKRVAESYSKTQ